MSSLDRKALHFPHRLLKKLQKKNKILCLTKGCDPYTFCPKFIHFVAYIKFLKKHNKVKKTQAGYNWCVLCHRSKRENI